MSDQEKKEQGPGGLGSLRGEGDRGLDSSSAEESPPEGSVEPTASHLSFIHRLQKRVGRELDPGIQLQVEGDPQKTERWGASHGTGSAKPLGDSSKNSSGDSSETSSRSSSGSSSGRRLIDKLVGSVSLSSRYRISDELARGGMGTILRVWDDDLRRNLAMKVMHGVAHIGSSSRTNGPDEERLVRFLEEAQITGQLDHPGVVPVHDLGIDPEGRCYFTMRLVRGRELKEILRLARAREEGWTTTRALGLILKVCEAMAFAHSKSVIHRDLKPSNIMVGRFGETYVMDWGLARVLGREDAQTSLPKDASSLSIVRTDRRDTEKDDPASPLVTLEGDVVGTPSYMAPEQARGDLANLGPRADVYSMGAILYELLTARVPYLKKDERISAHAVLSRVLNGEPEPVAKLAQDQPAELVAICEKAMARDQADRYPSILAVAEDIQAYLEDRVVKAYGGGALVEIKKWVQRNRGAAMSLGALLIVAIVAAVGFNVQTSRQLEKLGLQEAQTREARDAARDNLARAQISEADAKEALLQARESATAARLSEGNARRSGYSANLLATIYSIRLGDMEGARDRLEACDPEIRGWEWRFLELESTPTLRGHGRIRKRGIGDRALLLPGGDRVFVYTRSGTGRIIDYETLEDVTESDKRINTGELNVSGSGISYSNLWESRSSAALRPGTNSVALFSSGPNIHLVDLDTAEASKLSIMPWLELIHVQTERSLGGDKASMAVKRSYLRSLAWSPDGRFLAAGGFDGSVMIFDMDQNQPTPRILRDKHRDAVLGLAWDADGSSLASVSKGGEFALWNLEKGRTSTRTRKHEGPATDVVFDPRRGSFITCGRDGAVLRWSRKGGGFEATLARLGAPLQAIAVRANSGQIAVVTAPGSGEGNGRCVLIEPTEKINSVVGLLSFILSVERTTTRELLGAVGDLQDVFFSADGATVAAFGDRNALLVWDLEGPLSRLELGRGMVLENQLASLGVGPSPLDWGGFLPHNAMVGAADPMGQLLATAGAGGEVLLWSRETGFPVARLRGHGSSVTSIVFSPDGSLLASGSQDATIRLWNTRSASLVRVLREHERSIRSIHFSADGAKLYSTSGEKVLRTWDVTSGQTISSLDIGGQSGMTSAISEDGRLLATASREIIVREAGSQKEIIRLPRTTGRVRSLCFSKDNTAIWAGYSKGSLRKWSLETGELLHELKDHKGEVLNAILNRDGSRLMTTGRDASIHVRDFDTGHTLLDLELRDDVRHLSLGPDDSYLLAVLFDGSSVLLETSSGERRLLEQMRESRARERTQREVLRQTVLDLLAQYGFPSEVRAAISRDANFDQEQRRIALSILDSSVDAPGYLAGLARKVLDDRNASSETLATALSHAQAANQLRPDDPRLEVVLGSVQMRAGRPADALEVLGKVLDKGRTDRNAVEDLVGEDAYLSANYFLLLAMLDVGATNRLNEVRAEIENLLDGNPALRVRAGLSVLREEVDLALTAKGF